MIWLQQDEEISELTYANQEEYFVNIQKKLKKQVFLSRLIDLLAEFTAKRYQSIYSTAKPAICRRYKQLSKLAETEKYYPGTGSLTEAGSTLVKRAPEARKATASFSILCRPATICSTQRRRF